MKTVSIYFRILICSVLLNRMAVKTNCYSLQLDIESLLKCGIFSNWSCIILDILKLKKMNS